MIFSAKDFVKETMGSKYVEPSALDLEDALKNSTPFSPLIFVLSPGADPMQLLEKLAQERRMEKRFFAVALGQGQATVAEKLIEQGLEHGHWIFLANCHLMHSWLPTLEKRIQHFTNHNPHPDFRLWLSSKPTEQFPTSILQKGIKMTIELPKGLHSNLHRIYQSLHAHQITTSSKPQAYSKLLFSLAFFHSILLDRRRFKSLGFNILYDFNDTDFLMSADLLRTYLDSYDQIPWQALKYFIAEANYGGRVTDEHDRRVLSSYLSRIYCEDCIHVKRYKLSESDIYFIPEDASVQGSLSYVRCLPFTDDPVAFGQHPNAEIPCLKEEGQTLIQSLLQLQPIAGDDCATEERRAFVIDIVQSLVKSLPALFDLQSIRDSRDSDPSALDLILYQEIERYNVLLKTISTSCEALVKGIKGWVVMSVDLEELASSLKQNRVPALWLKAYPSLKSLSSWCQDLIKRLDQLKEWSEGRVPRIFWLSGLTYPSGFLTAVLQTSARTQSIAIDDMTFEVTVEKDAERTEPADGVLVRGLFLEGAGWDRDNDALCEPHLTETSVEMPILWFRPVPIGTRPKRGKNLYPCPLYLNSVRGDTGDRPSFLMHIDLDAGERSSADWVLRGTALVLARAV